MSNCRKKGHPDSITREIWRQIESFAGYAFAKGHSASYAVESYQSLYLKTYFPLEYMVAVINNGGGFYSAELYIHETRKCGGQILAPCVNNSKYETTLKGSNVYLGFHLLNGLEHQVATDIYRERRDHGAFKSLEDFLKRVNIGPEQIEILIRIDAFRFTEKDKRKLLWEARFLLNHDPFQGSQTALFEPEIRKFELPEFEVTELEHIYDQLELLGFPLSNPFSLLEKGLEEPILLASSLSQYLGLRVTIYGYLVTVKNTRTSNGKRMQFGTFLDYSGDWIDTVHFPQTVSRFPFRGKGIYKIMGKVVEEFGYYTIEVEAMFRMPYHQLG